MPPSKKQIKYHHHNKQQQQQQKFNNNYYYRNKRRRISLPLHKEKANEEVGNRNNDKKHQIDERYKNNNLQHNPSSIITNKSKMNLMKILYLREITTKKYNTIIKEHILKNDNNIDDDNNKDNNWKEKYIHRISFEKLNTPLNDAILHIDRTGSYVIGVGTLSFASSLEINSNLNNSNEVEDDLLLRFYGIPSRSRLDSIQKKKNKYKNITSPLLLSIPIHSINTQEEDNRFSYYENNNSVTNFPLQIITSHDIGIAILHHTTEQHEDGDALSTITIFKLPASYYADKLTSYQCCNIRFATKCKSNTICNLLWPVCYIPIHNNNSTGSYYKYTNYGYLYINDEDDGFRFTWIDTYWNDNNNDIMMNNDDHSNDDSTISKKKEKHASKFFFREENTTWEKIESTPNNGRRIVNKKQRPSSLKDGDIYIANELYLHIHLLLHDIIQNHKNLFPNTTISDYYTYNIISVLDQGKVIILVIVFQKPCKHKQQTYGEQIYYGVVVNINVITKKYNEMQWVQKKAHAIHKVCIEHYLNEWCRLLCVHYRKQHVVCSKGDNDRSSNIDDLYPQCNAIQNNAVTNGKPVHVLNCDDVPIQIYYDL